MIDNLGLFVSHGLMLLATVVLLRRPDLDREEPAPDRKPRRRPRA